MGGWIWDSPEFHWKDQLALVWRHFQSCLRCDLIRDRDIRVPVHANVILIPQTGGNFVGQVEGADSIGDVLPQCPEVSLVCRRERWRDRRMRGRGAMCLEDLAVRMARRIATWAWVYVSACKFFSSTLPMFLQDQGYFWALRQYVPDRVRAHVPSFAGLSSARACISASNRSEFIVGAARMLPRSSKRTQLQTLEAPCQSAFTCGRSAFS
jgi:hypothetical protein